MVNKLGHLSCWRISVCTFTAIIAAGCSTLAGNARPDFSGMWDVTEYDEITRPDEAGKYTQEAQERIAFYLEHFNPVEESHSKFCDMAGMPWTILGRARDYPREIYQSKDRLFYFFEYMDSYRQIRIGDMEIPESFPGTREGYSIAHWEGDELVVITEGFTEIPHMSKFQRSDEAKIIERWRKFVHSEYGEVIEVKVEVIDPVVYTEPVYGRALWKRAPDGVQLGQYACPASLWEDYADKKLEAIENAAN